MKTKKPKELDDFIGSGKADQHTSKTVKQTDSKPVKQKKMTFYIRNPANIKKLKQIGLDTERGISDLANEAIEDLVKKHNSKPA